MIDLPPGKYFMVMWNIAQQFGGMTSMCMARARNFLEYAGVNAPVLSFSLTGRYKALEQSLKDRGYLHPENQVLNVFEYYRGADLAARPSIDAPDWRSRRPARSDFRHEQIIDQDGIVIANIFRDDDNAITYRECFRPDGSVFFVDHSDVDDEGGRTKRRVWLIDQNGDTVRTFGGASQFYYAWMDELIGDDHGTFIFDDKSAATILRRYKRPNALMITPVHSNHIKSAGDPERGEFDPNRLRIFEESWRWDSLVFLTQTQYSHYTTRFGAATNLAVIPNPVKLPEDEPQEAERVPSRGVVIGRLAKSKNYTAAIEAIRLARESVPEITLDIYGEGEQRPELEKVIAAGGLEDAVRLHGHVTGAAQEFSTGGFSLMTSRYEGFPLAALESLSRGCPLISFNLRYGPPDLVGKDEAGFIVGINDVKAMADRIVRIATDPALSERMGKAGRERAAACSSEAVTRAWADLISRLWAARTDEPYVTAVEPTATAHADGNGRVIVSLVAQWTQNSGRAVRPDDIHAHLRIVPDSYGRSATQAFDIEQVTADNTLRASLTLDPDSALESADGVRNAGAKVEVVGTIRRMPFRCDVTLAKRTHWSPAAAKDGRLYFNAERVDAL